MAQVLGQADVPRRHQINGEKSLHSQDWLHISQIGNDLRTEETPEMMKAALVFAIEDARSGSTDNLRSGISVSRMDYGNFYVWDARPGVDFSMTYAFGVELDEMTSDEIADYVLANWRPEYDIARGQKAEEALR